MTAVKKGAHIIFWDSNTVLAVLLAIFDPVRKSVFDEALQLMFALDEFKLKVYSNAFCTDKDTINKL